MYGSFKRSKDEDESTPWEVMSSNELWKKYLNEVKIGTQLLSEESNKSQPKPVRTKGPGIPESGKDNQGITLRVYFYQKKAHTPFMTFIVPYSISPAST